MPELRVTVFCGSNPKPGEPAYAEALRLGQLLGEAGHTVLTGGYLGAMEAVSRGAAEAGGRVVGVTCDEIEHWRPVRPNPWVMEELRFQTIRERLYVLVEHCDAALALPGGVGTLTEVALTWNLLLTNAIPPKPLILIGPGWRAVVESFFTAFDGYVPEGQRKWLAFANDIEDAVARIKRDE